MSSYLKNLGYWFCGKIVGSRLWGAVKHLKTGKNAKVGDRPLKKQATIFGASYIEKARSERAAVEADPDRVYEVWTCNI